eukprot:11371323-Ditylum_brightwellii.AAC.1
MLICFQDQCCNYKGVVKGDEMETNEDNNGLAIGAFGSAFCADISATYTYEMCKNIFTKLRHAGLYRDDSLSIFEGKRTSLLNCGPPSDTNANLDGREVDEMVETAIPKEEWEKWEEKVTMVNKEAFPYLDIKMYWEDMDLQIAVYSKENQRIKY